MRTIAYYLLGLTVSMSVALVDAAKPGLAQSGCDAPISRQWLRLPSDFVDGPHVPKALVRIVNRNSRAAIKALQQRDVLPLSTSQAASFVISPALPKLGHLKPYLVRAVLPEPIGPNDKLQVLWVGSELRVDAFSMGCRIFTNRPLVIFLPRQPSSLIVAASGAL